MNQIFEGRTLVIATKHHKEKVIAPLFEQALGIRPLVPALDTDVLGTFTGEVERIQDPLTAARLKCQMALDLTGLDLALSSEGSFGPHPAAYFLPADEEILFCLDRKHAREYWVRELSTQTNFAAREISTLPELKAFADKAGFPAHALVLRCTKGDSVQFTKGITQWEVLETTFRQYMDSSGTIQVETDMRALYNPSRMKVIEQATLRLCQKIQTLCPDCKAPGFEVTRVIPGLPCEACGFPTRSTLTHVYRCAVCSHESDLQFPAGKSYENPMYCDQCNP